MLMPKLDDAAGLLPLSDEIAEGGLSW